MSKVKKIFEALKEGWDAYQVSDEIKVKVLDKIAKVNKPSFDLTKDTDCVVLNYKDCWIVYWPNKKYSHPICFDKNAKYLNPYSPLNMDDAKDIIDNYSVCRFNSDLTLDKLGWHEGDFREIGDIDSKNICSYNVLNNVLTINYLYGGAGSSDEGHISYDFNTHTYEIEDPMTSFYPPEKVPTKESTDKWFNRMEKENEED